MRYRQARHAKTQAATREFKPVPLGLKASIAVKNTMRTLDSRNVLGIVEGVTEFLPISSSGHLLVVPWLFDWNDFGGDAGLEKTFDVALHIGTLVAILTFFRVDIFSMARALPAAFSTTPPAAGRLLQLIAVGTLPIIVVGLLFTDRIEQALRQPAVAAGALTAGALAMLIAERLGPRTRSELVLGWLDVILIGCAQAAALIPGMSRSGSTGRKSIRPARSCTRGWRPTAASR